MDIFKKFAHHGQIIPSDDDICDNFMQQNNVMVANKIWIFDFFILVEFPEEGGIRWYR